MLETSKRRGINGNHWPVLNHSTTVIMVSILHCPSRAEKDVSVSFHGHKAGLLMGQVGVCQTPCSRDLWFCLSSYWGRIDLQRALGPHKKNYSYRIIRFEMELKLSRSMVVRLGSTEPQSSTEDGAGSVEAAGGEGPHSRASMLLTPMLARAPLLLYALHVDFGTRLYL